MPAKRKGYCRPGGVVLPRRFPVGCGRDGCHRGGQCPAKRWCARRTLHKNNRLRMCVGRERRAHHGILPTCSRGYASPVSRWSRRDGCHRGGKDFAQGAAHPGVGPSERKIFRPDNRGRAMWATMYTAHPRPNPPAAACLPLKRQRHRPEGRAPTDNASTSAGRPCRSPALRAMCRQKKSPTRRAGQVDRQCATRHDAAHQHDHRLGAIDVRNKRKAPRAESMRGNYGTGAIHIG